MDCAEPAADGGPGVVAVNAADDLLQMEDRVVAAERVRRTREYVAEHVPVASASWIAGNVAHQLIPDEEGLQLHRSARLGVVRLDFDYPPAPGDVDHPGSYGYDVYYRVVPGLTFAMCQSGKMPPEIEERFTNAVKWLDAKGVSISIPRASNWLAD